MIKLSQGGGGGLHQNSLEIDFIVVSISCFWSLGNILFLAEIIAGQRSALMCNYICASDFQSPALKILHFLSDHPETFRICSKDHLEEIVGPEF